MKKFLPIASPYLMMIFPIILFLGLSLLLNSQKQQNELALQNALSKSEIIASSQPSSNFVKLLLK